MIIVQLKLHNSLKLKGDVLVIKLLVNHKYKISNGCGEYITGTVKKIDKHFIYLDNCIQFTGIAEREIGKYKIAKKDLGYIKKVY